MGKKNQCIVGEVILCIVEIELDDLQGLFQFQTPLLMVISKQLVYSSPFISTQHFLMSVFYKIN